jgi:opacity protein-like surface antigen
MRMRNSLKLVVVSCAAGGLLLGSALSAYSQRTPFYVRADAGGNVTQDLDLQEFFGIPLAPGAKVKLDPGFRMGLAGGYQATDWLAGEIETGFIGNHISSITGATVNRVHDAAFANFPFLVNAKLQWPNRTRLTPYIGGGVGFSVAVLDTGYTDYDNYNGHIRGSAADTVFAYQAIGGLRYNISQHMGLSVEYRYFVADSAHWEAEEVFGTPPNSDSIRFGSSHTHVVSLAFEYRF